MIKLEVFKNLIQENDGKERLNLVGEAIVICTTTNTTEIEEIVCYEWLCSDGVIIIKDSELNIFSCVPTIPKVFKCFEIVWD